MCQSVGSPKARPAEATAWESCRRRKHSSNRNQGFCGHSSFTSPPLALNTVLGGAETVATLWKNKAEETWEIEANLKNKNNQVTYSYKKNQS